MEVINASASWENPRVSSRKREPGFYVSVLAPRGFGAHRTELLDGPWPTRAAAERRSAEIAAGRAAGSGDAPSIVQIAEDGFTILREGDLS